MPFYVEQQLWKTQCDEHVCDGHAASNLFNLFNNYLRKTFLGLVMIVVHRGWGWGRGKGKGMRGLLRLAVQVW